MPMLVKVFKQGFIPALIFLPLLRLAHHIMFRHMETSGAGEALENMCPPKLNGPYALSYTGVAAVDSLLCVLTTFFHSSFDPSLEPLLIEFGTSLAVVVFLPFNEMSRNGRSWLFKWPLPIIFSVLYQLYGAGVMFNIFWLIMVVSGHSTMRPGPRAKIDQADAEANLFALFIGYFVMSALMGKLEDPIVTAIWQAFPLLMSLLRSAHFVIRPRRGERGYVTLQATFLLTFVVAAAGHLYVIWSLRHDLGQIAKQLLPQTNPPSGVDLTIATQVFLQWDMTMTFVATFIGMLWFANNVHTFIGLVAWIIVAVPLLGPGATVAGVMMWRERKLHGFRR